ncbi:uncharacterized protein [Epargyreus clarus]|uniref:uncharacterized protein n=1 Tax=Epargyreus clarus TaxID=520877 RepID=UPI003C2B7DCD
MPSSRIPSPARSQGAKHTPRRYKPRVSRSVGSPARSDTSVKLSAVVRMDSFALSPMPTRRSVLTDTTDIDIPRRKSWWKKLDENSREIMEVLNTKEVPEGNIAIEEYIDVDVLSQEKKNYTLDLPDSSDGESINSIVIPQRKLFTQKESQTRNKFGQVMDNRENLAKLHRTQAVDERDLNVGPKNLFNQGTKPRSKPIFPSALLNISANKTLANKTKELPTNEPKGQVKSLFGNRPGTKRKNMFADFIVSESEDEISEIQPKVFGFQKKLEQKNVKDRGGRAISPTSSMTDTEMDDWRQLPSSTMVDHQLEDGLITTPIKRARLSKLSEAVESINTTANKTKQSNKTLNSRSRSKNASKFKEMDENELISLTKELDTVAPIQNQSKNKSVLRIDENFKNLSHERSLRKRISKTTEHSKSKNASHMKTVNEDVRFEDIVNNEENKYDEGNKSNKSKQNKTSNTLTKIDQALQSDDDDFTLEYENDDEVENVEKNNTVTENVAQISRQTLKNTENSSNAENVNRSKQLQNKTKNHSVVQNENVPTGKDGGPIAKEKVTRSPIKEKSIFSEVEKDTNSNDNEDVQSQRLHKSYNKSLNNRSNLSHNTNNKTKHQEKDNVENKETEVNKILDVVASPEAMNKDDEQHNSESNKVDEYEDENKDDEDNQEDGIDNEMLDEAQATSQDVEDGEQSNPDNDEEDEEQGDEVQNSQNVDNTNEDEEMIDNYQNKSQENISNEEIDGNDEEDENDEAENENEVVAEQDDEIENQNEALEDQDEEAEDQDEEIEDQNEEEIDDENQDDEAADVSGVVDNDENEESVTEDNNDANQEGNNEEDDSDVSHDIHMNASQEEVEDGEDVEMQENDQNVTQEVESEDEEVSGDHDVSEAEDNEEQEAEDNEEQEAEDDEQEAEDDEQEAEVDEQEAENSDQNVSHNVEIEDEDENHEDEETHEESPEEEIEQSDVQNESEDEIDNENVNESEDEVDNHDQSEDIDTAKVANETHDTTGRHRQHELRVPSPEAILHDKTNQMESFTIQGRNTSVRKTKSLIRKNRSPSLAPVRESTGLSDGARDSSAEGSGWDSHRTTRLTMRQTIGRDHTPRKSLRALVMEKSAKRHTNFTINDTKVPQANSTELPRQESFDVDDQEDDFDQEMPSDHEESRRMRQTTLEMYLQKVKEKNIERKKQLEEEIRSSLKAPTRDMLNPFKVPAIPKRTVRHTKPQNKGKAKVKSVIPLNLLPAEVLEDMKYKPPKRYQPANASWITKRLYKFLETKLEPKYDYKARIRSEKLVETIYNFTKDIRRLAVAPPHAVEALKQEMARLNIVGTHVEFYEFFHEYMPREVRVKVVPDVFNKISLPKHGVFSDILR